MMGTWGFIIQFSQLLCMFKNLYNKMPFFFSLMLDHASWLAGS